MILGDVLAVRAAATAPNFASSPLACQKFTNLLNHRLR